MTSVRQPVRGPAPAPAPRGRPTESKPPRLRVLTEPELSARGKRRRARLLAAAFSVIIVGGLFGLAVFNVMLAQGQAKLNGLEERATAQQLQYERLRLEVAQLQSPERVVAAAQERLGMVPPAEVIYLTPVTAAPPSGVSRGSSSVQAQFSPVTSDWAQVKRHLAAQP